MLKISVGYGFCCLIARFATSSVIRFVVWVSFLSLSAAYWLLCVVEAYARAWSGSSGAIGLTTTGSGFLGITLSSASARTVDRFMGPVILLYLLGLFCMGVAGVWKRIQLARALTYRSEPQEALVKLFRDLAAEVQAPTSHLWLLPGLTSPASLGWLRPAVYLPMDDGNEESLEVHDILCHELAHVCRRDSLWDSVSRLCRWIVFFHPFMHRAFYSLRLEREVACDAVVVRRHPEKRDVYADTLVRFGWKSSLTDDPDHIGIGLTSQAGVLNARVKSILEGERVYSRWAFGTRTLLASIACWTFAAIAPALWIGFRVIATPQPVMQTVGSIARPSRQRRRFPRQRGYSAPVVREQTVVSGFVIEPLPTSARQGPTKLAFHLQNEDEPMSNPVPDPETSSAPVEVNSTRPGRPARPQSPSATSVLLDTAGQLSRIGMGRDHDHDHE